MTECQMEARPRRCPSVRWTRTRVHLTLGHLLGRASIWHLVIFSDVHPSLAHLVHGATSEVSECQIEPHPRGWPSVRWIHIRKGWTSVGWIHIRGNDPDCQMEAYVRGDDRLADGGTFAVVESGTISGPSSQTVYGLLNGNNFDSNNSNQITILHMIQELYS